jgi:hypothetical protein
MIPWQAVVAVLLATAACDGTEVRTGALPVDGPGGTGQGGRVGRALDAISDTSTRGKPTCLVDSDCFPLQKGTVCQQAVCNPTSHACELAQAATGTACDHSDPCVGAAQCNAQGQCEGTAAKNCSDGIDCTVDGCNAADGCVHTTALDGSPCDDGYLCTAGDACQGGICVGKAACDDQDPCTADLCAPGVPGAPCTHTPLPAGAQCDDGDPCTVATTCDQGGCKGGLQLACDDGNPCTSDFCAATNAQSDCKHTAVPDGTGTCSDANACTTGDTCKAGKCQGQPGVCECQTSADCKDDGNLCNGVPQCVGSKCVADPASVVVCPASSNPCVAVQCVPATGVCIEQSAGAGKVCSDGNACTAGDTCGIGGNCVGGQAVLCDDGVPCTKDGCDVAKGCIAEPWPASAGIPCDDNNTCTFGDVCDGGACTAGKNACQCQTDADCKPLDDGDACNGSLVCKGGACVSDGKTVVCKASSDPCTATACDPKSAQCVSFAKPEGSACGSATACTSGGQCKGGACVGAVVGDCSDGNACTKDACGPTGCTHTPAAGQTCDDGNPCTNGDQCNAGGQCQGGANTCQCQTDADCGPSGASCTVNKCDQAAGKCQQVQKPQGTACDDGNACTFNDVCQGGACAGGSVNCADNNPCTDDSCDAKSGCTHASNAAPCDDGDACTTGDQCGDGSCKPGTPTCACKSDADCKDDGDLCNGVTQCLGNVCKPKPGSVVTCDPKLAPLCTSNLCNPNSGKCVLVSIPDGTPCDDGTLCTSDNFCKTGLCTGKNTICDDGNACTEDSCDPAKGCVFVVKVGLPCSDGNVCTDDACDSAGKCASKPNTTICDDGNPCTQGDLCSAGKCVGGADVCAECKTAADCKDDGNLCNGTPMCQGGKCLAGSPVSCPSSNDPCQSSACDPASGVCIETKASGTACDDGDACTGPGVCVQGVCTAPPIQCDDKNPCTVDTCIKPSGCKFTPSGSITCDDGDPCTLVSACLNGKCQGFVNQCGCKSDGDCPDDSNLCNGVPGCIGNKCQAKPGTVVVCSPAGDTACLKNQCLTANGKCNMTPLPLGTLCDDKSPCTVNDACALGQCQGVALDCGDGIACTSDQCSVPGGCVHVGDNSKCNDGKPCTSDTCDLKLGCQNPPASGAPCDDGNACTSGDVCKGGTCQGGAVKTCDDGNLCTADSCDAKLGCVTKPQDGAACNDGNACTSNDLCKGGTCLGSPLACDDGNSCTTDACDPATGKCSAKPAPGQPCDDGSKCTDGDTCLVNGACAGAAKNCDDGNLCTADSCAVATGNCTNTPLPGLCNDGNPCTADACNPKTGACASTPAPGAPCNDNSACTQGDTCQAAGTCAGSKIACSDGKACTQDDCDPATGCTFTPLKGFNANFDDGGMGGITSSLSIPPGTGIQWQIDGTQFKSPSKSLYIGKIEPFTGTHSYNVNSFGIHQASLPTIAIPAGVTGAKMTLALHYERDPKEPSPPGCSAGGLSDIFAVLVDNQPRAARCSVIKGFETVTVNLQDKVGGNAGIVLAFTHNQTNNNGGGAWVDDVNVSWTCDAGP